MKVFSGWLLAKNTKTKKMIPFFVKVRSGDIVPTDDVDIDSVLKKTSSRWTLTRHVNDSHKSYYYYEQSYENPGEDPYGEEIPSTYLDCSLCYAFHKDGMLDITGVARLDGTKITNSSLGSDYLAYEKKIYLPYQPGMQTSLTAGVAGGDIDNMTVYAVMSSAQVTSNELNYGQSDKNKYPFVMDIFQIRRTIAGYNPLAVYKDSDGFQETDVTAYGEKYIPIRFEWHGFWKPAE